MFKRLISVFLCSFFSFFLYAQEITVTDFVIVAKNINALGSGAFISGVRGGVLGTGAWGGYLEIVDNDIQELMNNENVQYSDTLFDSGNQNVWKWKESLEPRFIEELFDENILTFEQFAVYRLRFNKDGTEFVAYTTGIEPYSFIAFFRIFDRVMSDGINQSQSAPFSEEIFEEGATKNFMEGLSENITTKYALLIVIIGGIVAGSLTVFMIKRKHRRSNSSTSGYSQ